jgi:hypothetical protein
MVRAAPIEGLAYNHNGLNEEPYTLCKNLKPIETNENGKVQLLRGLISFNGSPLVMLKPRKNSAAQMLQERNAKTTVDF